MSDEYRYGNMIQEYYVARVRELAEARARTRARIRTPRQVMALREAVRRRLRRCFGRFPARTPLEPRVTGVVQRSAYTIEKVLFYSRPGFPVTANLYLPRRSAGPRPAVLGVCGHSAVGKAEPAYQAFCQHLARQGYVVLIYDPISQGERLQYPGRQGAAQPVSCTQEHNMAGNQMALVGEFFGLWQVWDGLRSLDYLLSRPEVDRTHVGVTGNSGGGTLTTYLSALDDRFTMAAPSCFVTTYLCNLENELAADSEQVPPGILAAGLDLADFFVAQIPRPTLLLGQRNDYFDTRGLEAVYTELRRLYALVGAEDRVALWIGPDDHGYSRANREAMYRFFNRHAGVRARWPEPDRWRPEKPQVLAVTPRGQVHYLPVRRVFDFTREKAAALARSRPRLSGKALASRLARILNLPKRPATPHHRVRRAQTVCVDPRLIRSTFAVETEPGIQVVLQAYTRRGYLFHFPRGEQATLYVPHRSSAEEVLAGQAPGVPRLWCVDVRGFGETTSRAADGGLPFLSPRGADYFHAATGLLLAESYAGRRVHDLLSVLDLFQAHGYRRVHLVGRGLGAITAALAACLHPLVRRVTLYNALRSYHELTQTPVQSWPLSALVFGILKQFDLPECYALLRSRGLVLKEPWDSQMQPARRPRRR